MASDSRVGTVIDNKYRLDEQIGHGGMGAVYMGTQLMVDRKVAIKLLHPTFATHENVQARFEVEAKAIARLNHPNCITLYDFGYSTELNAFFTVVEFIQGAALESLIGSGTSVADTVGIIRQIASALDHAHHHGVLHRDLKPENIMLSRMTDGTEMVKVLDFGIAQIMKGPASDSSGDGDFKDVRLTQVGEVFGTAPYMSPEQARATRDLTPAADLYSLGVIFYELVEGRLPFLADNPLDIMIKHINEPPPPFTRGGVPAEVEELIFALLDKDPKGRPQAGKTVVQIIDAMPRDIFENASATARQHQLRRAAPLAPAGIVVSNQLSADHRSEPTLAHMPDSLRKSSADGRRSPQQMVETQPAILAEDEWSSEKTYVLADEIVGDPARPAAITSVPRSVPGANSPTMPPAATGDWRPEATRGGVQKKKLLPLMLGILALLLIGVIAIALQSGDSDLSAGAAIDDAQPTDLSPLPVAESDGPAHPSALASDDPEVEEPVPADIRDKVDDAVPTLVTADEVAPEAQTGSTRPAPRKRASPQKSTTSEKTKRERPVKLDLGLGTESDEGERRPAKLDL